MGVCGGSTKNPACVKQLNRPLDDRACPPGFSTRNQSSVVHYTEFKRSMTRKSASFVFEVKSAIFMTRANLTRGTFLRDANSTTSHVCVPRYRGCGGREAVHPGRMLHRSLGGCIRMQASQGWASGAEFEPISNLNRFIFQNGHIRCQFLFGC